MNHNHMKVNENERPKPSQRQKQKRIKRGCQSLRNVTARERQPRGKRGAQEKADKQGCVCLVTINDAESHDQNDEKVNGQGLPANKNETSVNSESQRTQGQNSRHGVCVSEQASAATDENQRKNREEMP